MELAPPWNSWETRFNDPLPSRRRLAHRDKGRKLLHGLKTAEEKHDLVMFVDADDLISSKLVDWVKSNPQFDAWYLYWGYIHRQGRPWVFKDFGFHHLCGSSIIVRRRHLDSMIEADGEEAAIEWLGRHNSLFQRLQEVGSSLCRVPFPAALYRVGHGENNDTGERLSSWKRQLLRVPSCRWLSPPLRQEFFGQPKLTANLVTQKGC